jgi:hypothetical protein
MPVTINGDGSITGLSVGGLGSGVVNTASIADGAVSAVKRSEGSVLQLLTGSISSYSATSATYAEKGTLRITPKRAGSSFLIMLSLYVNNYVGSNANSYAGVKYYRDVNGGGDVDIGGMGTANKVYGQSIGTLIALGNMCGPIHKVDTPSYSLGNYIDYSIQLAQTGSGTAQFAATSDSHYYSIMEIAG